MRSVTLETGSRATHAFVYTVTSFRILFLSYLKSLLMFAKYATVFGGHMSKERFRKALFFITHSKIV